MTWDGAPWAIDGAQNDATIGRLKNHADAAGSGGVEFATDCIVSALDTPGPGVKIGSGAVTIIGRENTWQGAYFGYNVGDEPVDIAATGSSPRSDLVIVRVEDPTVPGAGWQYPADRLGGPYIFTRVIQGVPDTTETVEELGESWSAEAFARVDIPANTSVITGSMIKSVRRVSRPHSDVEFFTLQGVWDTPDSVGNVIYPDWEQFPNGADWTVKVPWWATQAVIIVAWNGLDFLQGTGADHDGIHPPNAYGYLRAKLGSVATPQTNYHENDSGGNVFRRSYGGGGTIAIPAAMRGTSQQLTLEGAGLTGYTGKMQADGGSGVTAQILFREVATTDVPDRSPR